MSKTKKIRITLAALTRVEYTEVLEIPVDMTDEQLDQLVDSRYKEVDGGKFYDDPNFWEKGTCEHSPADPSAPIQGKVVIEDDDIEVIEA